MGRALVRHHQCSCSQMLSIYSGRSKPTKAQFKRTVEVIKWFKSKIVSNIRVSVINSYFYDLSFAFSVIYDPVKVINLLRSNLINPINTQGIFYFSNRPPRHSSPSTISQLISLCSSISLSFGIKPWMKSTRSLFSVPVSRSASSAVSSPSMVSRSRSSFPRFVFPLICSRSFRFTIWISILTFTWIGSQSD